jgi:Ca-activated chloride channel family protein
LQHELSLTASLDRPIALAGGDSVRYLVVGLGAPDATPEGPDRMPINLAAVIDRSGSMAGGSLDAARAAVCGVIERLQPADILSVVSFDDSVIVHLDGHAMTDGAGPALAAVRSLETGGSTDLAAGWAAGADCVARAMVRPGFRNHVLLLSDGHANRGIVDPALLALAAEQRRGQGITSSCVGIGDGYSTTQLLALAEHGGGRLHDAEYTDEIVEVVMGELGALSRVTAEDVRIEVRATGGRVSCVSPVPSTGQPWGASAVAGSLTGGLPGEPATPRALVFRIDCPGAPAGAELQLHVTATWRRPGGTGTISAAPVCATLHFGDRVANRTQERDIARSLAVMEAWRAAMVSRVIELNRDGAFEQAARYLAGQMPHFRRYCRGLPGEETFVAEMDRFQRRAVRPWDERRRKEMHLSNYKAQRRELDYRTRPRGDWSGFIE